MMMKNKVSVVIVTRNRAKDLQHCLGSLAMQSQLVDELIVVNNNSTDFTEKVVTNFAKSVSFPVKYVQHKKIGYPHVYNRGLKDASGDFIAFIDDDCVADVNWFENIKKMIETIPNVSAILGKSSEYYKKDVLALTKSYIDEIGKIGTIKNNFVTDLEILDSKNIVYNAQFLKKHKIRFDTNLLNYAQGASEDCDLGMQIYHAGGVAVYNKKMLVVHKDPTNFTTYFVKTVFTLKNHLVYEKKWKNIRKNIITKRSLSEKINLFFFFIKKNQLGFLRSMIVAFFVFITFLHIKILRIILKSEIEKMKVVQK